MAFVRQATFAVLSVLLTFFLTFKVAQAEPITGLYLVVLPVENSDGSMPDHADLSFSAYFEETPQDIINFPQDDLNSDITTGATRRIRVNLADFDSPRMGYTLVVEVSNSSNGESGQATAIIAGTSPLVLDTLTLAPGFGSISGTVSYDGLATGTLFVAVFGQAQYFDREDVGGKAPADNGNGNGNGGGLLVPVVEVSVEGPGDYPYQVNDVPVLPQVWVYAALDWDGQGLAGTENDAYFASMPRGWAGGPVAVQDEQVTEGVDITLDDPLYSVDVFSRANGDLVGDPQLEPPGVAIGFELDGRGSDLSELYPLLTQVTASVTSPWPGGATGQRWRANGWVGYGFYEGGIIPVYNPAESPVNTVTFEVAAGSANHPVQDWNADSEIEWLWVRQYELTAAVNPAGAGNVTGIGWADDGGVLGVEALETNPLYVFSHWSGDIAGAWVPAEGGEIESPEIELPMDGPRHVVANFVRVYALETTVSPQGAGQVAIEPELDFYPGGTEVTLEAAAAVGYRFVEWTGDIDGELEQLEGNGAVQSPVITVVMDRDRTITANFEEIPSWDLTVAVEPENSGVVDVNPEGELVEAGRYRYIDEAPPIVVTLAAQAAPGYRFSHWLGDVYPVGHYGANAPAIALADPVVEVAMDADKPVTAVFEPIPWLEVRYGDQVDGEIDILYNDDPQVEEVVLANTGEGLLDWAITGKPAWIEVGWAGLDNSGDLSPSNGMHYLAGTLPSGESVSVALTRVGGNAGESGFVTFENITATGGNERSGGKAPLNGDPGRQEPIDAAVRINSAPAAPTIEKFEYFLRRVVVGEFHACDLVGVDTPIRLTGSEYDDPEGDRHDATQVRVRRAGAIGVGGEGGHAPAGEAWVTIFESETLRDDNLADPDQALRRGIIRRNILEPGMDYLLEMRYMDEFGAWSNWGEVLISTVPAGETVDPDGLGVPRGQEVDGFDYNDPENKAIQFTDTLGRPVQVTAQVPAGSTLAYLRQDPEDLDEVGYAFPYGVYTTRVLVPAPGDQVQMVFTFPDPLPAGTVWYKYNEALDDWEPYLDENGNPLYVVDGATVTVTLVDGGYGDADFVANGVIVDPAGPGMPFGLEYLRGGGGCFIATASFGSESHPLVSVLRRFRDERLLASGPGRSAVGFYYRHSPIPAAWLAGHAWARGLVRAALLPALVGAWLSLNPVFFALVFLLAGLGLAFRSRFRRIALSASAAVALLAVLVSPAFALDVNRLLPAPGEPFFVNLRSTQTLDKGQLSAGLFGGWSRVPLEGIVGGNWEKLSESQAVGVLGVAWGFTPDFQLGLSVPYLFTQSSSLTGVDEPDNSGFGDFRLEGKYRFSGGKDRSGFALVPYLSLDTGNTRAYMSSDANKGGLILVFDYNWCDHSVVAFNLGYEYQGERRYANLRIRHGLLFGLGASKLLENGRTALALELSGRTDDRWFSSSEETPLVLDGSVTQKIDRDLSLTFGLGTGLVKGYGAPDFRVFLGLRGAF